MPPRQRFVIRDLRDSDRLGLMALLRSSLGEGSLPRTEDFWRWKHEQNPFGRSPVLVAEDNGELIGVRAFLRWSWHRGSVTVPAVRAVDTATHPDHRGRRIFTKLTMTLVERLKNEGVAFVFNTPNGQSRPGYLKMGWRSLGRCPLMVQPRHPIALLRTVAKREAGGGRAAARPLRRGVPGKGVAECLEALDLDAMMPDAGPDCERLVTRPSRAYLSWRYRDIPGLQYAASWTVDGDGTAAAIYRLTRRRGLRELRISQLLIGRGPDSIRLGGGIVRQVTADCNPDVVLAIASPGTGEARALRRAGLYPGLRLGPVLTVRDLADSAPARHRQFGYSLGEVELF